MKPVDRSAPPTQPPQRIKNKLNMKKIFCLISLILIVFLEQVSAQKENMKPIERSVGSLHISIDPRMELLTAAQLISHAFYIDRNKFYSQEAIAYFKSFSSEEVVAQTDYLEQNHTFGADAPPEFMLYLSQVPELERQMAFSERLIERGGGIENLEQYKKTIKQFAEVSNFENFWNSRIPLYNQILDLTVAEMGEIDLVKVMEDYFNETQESYNVILSPAFSGGCGPKIPAKNGKYDIYACLTTWYEKDGIPYMAMEALRDYIWHEWGHSFVNPLTEKYRDRVDASSKLLEPIAKKQAGLAYPYWYQSVNEHIIRAIHVRLLEFHSDSQQAKTMLNNELSMRFIYIEPLIEKLKDFEKQRDEKGITFTEYYPELINLFDSLLKSEYWKQIDLNFKGPITKALGESMQAFIYPTQDSDTASLISIQNYITRIFNMSQLRNGLLLADTTALKTDLSDYGIRAYGTIESNLFLKQYAHLFPFKIENETIYADKEYTDPNIRLLTCFPNPYNSETGMFVCTAISNKVFQNSVLFSDGDLDYILLIDSETILSKGVYKKDGRWEF
jgi:hypothetical protein